MIVYVSIGNSDDKLSQREWSEFVADVDRATLLRDERHDERPVIARHGNWRSLPDDPWQNACWCIEFESEDTGAGLELQAALRQLAHDYGQDSIAWAEVKTTVLLGSST